MVLKPMPALLNSRSTRPNASATVGEQGVDLGGLGDVAGDGERLGAGGAVLRFGDRLVEEVLAAAAEDGVPAFGEKCGGDRLADAGAGAGDDGGLAVGGLSSPFRILPMFRRNSIANGRRVRQAGQTKRAVIGDRPDSGPGLGGGCRSD